MMLSTGFKSSTYYKRSDLKELTVQLWKSRHAQMPSIKQTQKPAMLLSMLFFSAPKHGL